MDDQFEQSKKIALDLVKSAETQARELILKHKDSIDVNQLADAINEIKESGLKSRVLLDLSRMDFICNRMDEITKNQNEITKTQVIMHESNVERFKGIENSVKEVDNKVGEINKKLDGYPLIKNAVVGTIAFIILGVFGALEAALYYFIGSKQSR